jgi:hypothetical protein
MIPFSDFFIKPNKKNFGWCYATKKINVLLLFSIGGMIPEKKSIFL